MGGVYLFLTLPRVKPLGENQATLDPATQILWSGQELNNSIAQQLAGVIALVRLIRQSGYTTDGRFESQLEDYDTFRADLNLYFPRDWESEAYGEIHDTVNPFGDSREGHVAGVWYLDFRIDQVQYVNRRTRRSLSISSLLERFVKFQEFERKGLATPLLIRPSTPTSHIHVGRWKPDIRVNLRLRAFTHRIFRDFDNHWRHVLRAEYNSTTLRMFARAVLCMATLRYQVREIQGISRFVDKGIPGSILSLPSWKPLMSSIVQLNEWVMMVCHSLETGLAMAQQHHMEGLKGAGNDASNETRYIILSVRSVVLCHFTITHELECTSPEQLFNGHPETDPPSQLALDYLLWATSADRPTVNLNPIQRLPIEIQDLILHHVSIEPIAAERVGCILDMGSSFSWKGYKRGADLGSPVSTDTHSLRIYPESQIWFGGCNSGVSYFNSAEEGKVFFPEPYPSVGIAVSSIQGIIS